MSNGAQAFVQGAIGALPNEAPAPVIVLQPVKSSNVTALGYDEPSSTMAVKFSSGLYHFTGVPKEVFTELLQADSKGSYFSTRVKGKYPSRRIEAPHPTPAPTALAPQAAWPFPTPAR